MYYLYLVFVYGGFLHWRVVCKLDDLVECLRLGKKNLFRFDSDQKKFMSAISRDSVTDVEMSGVNIWFNLGRNPQKFLTFLRVRKDELDANSSRSKKRFVTLLQKIKTRIQIFKNWTIEGRCPRRRINTSLSEDPLDPSLRSRDPGRPGTRVIMTMHQLYRIQHLQRNHHQLNKHHPSSNHHHNQPLILLHSMPMPIPMPIPISMAKQLSITFPPRSHQQHPVSSPHPSSLPIYNHPSQTLHQPFSKKHIKISS